MLQHIIVAFLAILLCLITDINDRRKRFLMPLAFILVTFFFAIRYNYGLDYVAYQTMFEAGDTSTSWRDGQERLFYIIMNKFSHFYEFVIFSTLLIMVGLYLWIRKYCNEKYYSLFFLMFMFMKAMSYNMMSAMRSSMAACVLWASLYFFYIKKKQWIPYLLLLFIGSGFHLSILAFCILPVVDMIIPKVKGNYLFCFFIGCFIISFLFGNERLFSFIVSSNNTLDTYSTYFEHMEENNISIFGTINNALFLFPAFYICRAKKQLIKSHKELSVLCILFLTIYSLNLDVQNRFTSYMGIFFIIIISVVAGGYKYKDQSGVTREITFTTKAERWIMLAPLIFKIGFDYYKFYLLMSSPLYIFLDGNPLIYQTILDAPHLP